MINMARKMSIFTSYTASIVYWTEYRQPSWFPFRTAVKSMNPRTHTPQSSASSRHTALSKVRTRKERLTRPCDGRRSAVRPPSLSLWHSTRCRETHEHHRHETHTHTPRKMRKWANILHQCKNEQWQWGLYCFRRFLKDSLLKRISDV